MTWEIETVNSMKKVKLFNGISDAVIEHILRAAEIKNYKKKKMVFSQNTSGNALYIILKGMIKIFEQKDTRRKILAYMGEKDFFGELALFGNNARSASAETITDVSLMEIKKGDFLNLLKKYPAICYNLLCEISNRLYQADKEISLVTFQDVPRRIAKILINLSKTYGKPVEHGKLIDLVLGHKEIAELAGTVRETAARVCAKLRKLKYIDYRDKQITITDESGLSSFIG